MSGLETVWVAILVALLLLAGGLTTLIGSLGLVRLPDFQARMHGTSMGSTLGLGCVIVASVIVSSVMAGRLVPNALSCGPARDDRGVARSCAGLRPSRSSR